MSASGQPVSVSDRATALPIRVPSARREGDSPFWAIAVAACIVAYAAYFSLYTSLVHVTFGTMAYDLGTVDQGVWLAGHGRSLFVTVRGLHLLGDHVRPIAFLLAPLYWVWDDVRILLVAQTLVIAAGAGVLWRIGKLALPTRPAWVAALCISYLLNPFVQNLNLDHVHPDAFATTLILASLYFLRCRRFGAFWVSAVLAMSCKEDVPLVYVALGVTLLAGPHRRQGALLAAVAAAYFAVCIGWILPHFNGVGFFRGRFFAARTTAEGSTSLVTRLLSYESAKYLFVLGFPLAFLFLLAPLTLVPAVPALISNLGNEAWYPRSPIYHYATSIVPFLYVGTMDALARLARGTVRDGRGAKRVLGSTLGRAIPAALLALAVTANLEFSRIPLTDLRRVVTMWGVCDSAPNREIESVLDRIPKDAAVSADYTLVPHLTHRERVYMFPNPFLPEQWGVHLENPPDPASVDYVVVRPGVSAAKQEKVLGPLVRKGIFVRDGDEKSVKLYVRARKG